MIARAVERARFAVEQKAAILVERDRPDSKRGRDAVRRFAVHRYSGCEPVERGRFRRPERGMLDRSFQMERARFTWRDLPGGRGKPDLGAALRTRNRAASLRRYGGQPIVRHNHRGLDGGGTFRHVAGEARGDENAVRGNRHGGGYIQPHVPVEARALIEPPLEARGVHLHGDGVRFVETDHVRDVDPEGSVATLLMPHEPAVHEHQGVPERPIELKPDALARVRRREFELAAIPAGVRVRMVGANGFESVEFVGVLVERQFHRPVVGQVHRAPEDVVELLGGGPAVHAAPGEHQAGGPVVPQVKFPAPVEQQVLAWRIRSKGKASRRKSGGKNAKQGWLIHFILLTPANLLFPRGQQVAKINDRERGLSKDAGVQPLAGARKTQQAYRRAVRNVRI